MQRSDTEPEHRVAVGQKLKRCKLQHEELSQSLKELVADIFSGQKTPPNISPIKDVQRSDAQSLLVCVGKNIVVGLCALPSPLMGRRYRFVGMVSLSDDRGGLNDIPFLQGFSGVESVSHASEDGMFPVQVVGRAMGDEKL